MNKCSLMFVLSVVLVIEQRVLADDSNGFFRETIQANQAKMVKVFGAAAGRVEGYATGILVSAEGHVLTTQGGILDGKQVRVLTSDGVSHLATVLRRDREKQLALLKIERPTPECFTLSDEAIGQKGDWVIALSNAFRVADKDEPLSAMMGIISLRTSMEARLNRRDIAYRGDLVLIDAVTSNPGAGGGAVLTGDGRLVGMIGKIINSSETNTRLNYAVPTATLWKFVNQIDSVTDHSASVEEREAIADFGLRIFRLGGKRDPAYVDRVKRGSLAAEAGLKSDDLVVSMAGQKVGTVRQYDHVVETLIPNEAITFVVKRGSKLLRLSLTPVRKARQ